MIEWVANEPLQILSFYFLSIDHKPNNHSMVSAEILTYICIKYLLKYMIFTSYRHSKKLISIEAWKNSLKFFLKCSIELLIICRYYVTRNVFFSYSINDIFCFQIDVSIRWQRTFKMVSFCYVTWQMSKIIMNKSIDWIYPNLKCDNKLGSIQRKLFRLMGINSILIECKSINTQNNH